MFQPMNEEGVDLYTLNRELDKTKSAVFMGNNAAFLASLMCSMEFVWTDEFPTAATNGSVFWWNPKWFLSMDPEARKTVLFHELWHVARLHLLRVGLRNPLVWNYACDIRINNDLENMNYNFTGIEDCWKDQSYGDMVEEDIYDLLIKNHIQPPPSMWDPNGSGDLMPMDSKDQAQLVNNVVKAVHQAKLAGKPGDIPGHIETTLKQFLAPVVPWNALLHKFFTDLLDEDYTWARPNRRYQDMYLPSKFLNDGRLEHLIYYLDVSGSISDADVIRFNSEVKYIKETYNPQKLTLVQFDTRITSEKVFNEEDVFEELIVVGRGGTSFVPVREHILEHKPTAAIIFSDMYCVPMETVPEEFPVIWVAIANQTATVPFGKIIHIRG